jgi:hypothetical protein
MSDFRSMLLAEKPSGDVLMPVLELKLNVPPPLRGGVLSLFGRMEMTSNAGPLTAASEFGGADAAN